MSVGGSVGMRSFFLIPLLVIFMASASWAQTQPAGGAGSVANQASKSDSSAQMAAAMMAMMLMMQCGPENPAACIMAPMAAAQALAAGDSADGAAASSAGLSVAAPTPPPEKAGAVNGSALVSQVKNELAKKGVTVTDNTVTLADGTQVPLNANSLTDAAMKSKGFSDQQIANGKAALAEAQAKAIEATHSNAETPSGVPSGGGAPGISAPSGTTVVQAGPAKRAAPNLSGMSKNLGGDKIGVAADNIFEMLTRRYKAKDAAESFIKN